MDVTKRSGIERELSVLYRNVLRSALVGLGIMGAACHSHHATPAIEEDSYSPAVLKWDSSDGTESAATIAGLHRYNEMILIDIALRNTSMETAQIVGMALEREPRDFVEIRTVSGKAVVVATNPALRIPHGTIVDTAPPQVIQMGTNLLLVRARVRSAESLPPGNYLARLSSGWQSHGVLRTIANANTQWTTYCVQ